MAPMPWYKSWYSRPVHVPPVVPIGQPATIIQPGVLPITPNQYPYGMGQPYNTNYSNFNNNSNNINTPPPSYSTIGQDKPPRINNETTIQTGRIDDMPLPVLPNNTLATK
jgi:hypothetical protein